MALPRSTEVLHYQLRIGQIPISPLIPLGPTEQLPPHARGYIHQLRPVQIERTAENPHALRVLDTQGHLLRRAITGLALDNAVISTTTNIPGLRRYYLTREPVEPTKMQRALRRAISRAIKPSRDSFLPARKFTQTKPV